jgi:hypothetical protein
LAQHNRMRTMSASIEQRSEGALPAAFHNSDDALSELDDGSSSLSDIEDKEAEQEDLEGLDFENDDESDANDSEAETERLENSPHNQRKLQDVVFSSQAESRIYERSPSKLQHQLNAEEDEDDDRDMEDFSDDEISIDKSAKSPSPDENEHGRTTATTSIEDSSGDGKLSTAAFEAAASKKRKRSLLPDPESIDRSDPDEPARKRTGSIGAPEHDYAIDDTASVDGEVDTSNPISGSISDAESLEAEEDDEDEKQTEEQEQEPIGDVDDNMIVAPPIEPLTPEDEIKKRWNKLRNSGTGTNETDVKQGEDTNGKSPSKRPNHETTDIEEPEDAVDVEVDDVEVAMKNEEERKRNRL